MWRCVVVDDGNCGNSWDWHIPLWRGDSGCLRACSTLSLSSLSSHMRLTFTSDVSVVSGMGVMSWTDLLGAMAGIVQLRFGLSPPLSPCVSPPTFAFIQPNKFLVLSWSGDHRGHNRSFKVSDTPRLEHGTTDEY